MLADPLEGTTRFVLLRESQFQRGCFPPCMCPLLETIPLRGTFDVTLVGIGDVTDFYTFDNAALETTVGAFRLTGYGDLRIGELADFQVMIAQLSLNGEPAEQFAGESSPAVSDWPRLEVVISINGMFCHDTVLTIRAIPVACAADFNADGAVGLEDLSILLSNFGQHDVPASQGDVDADADVDLTDLSELLSQFGAPCQLNQ